MVTCGTYQKKHHFNTPDKMNFFHETFLEVAEEFGWRLQAWALFSNYYHFIASSPSDPKTLKDLISKFHGQTARWINNKDESSERKVWHEYWDTLLTYEKSYLARLNYVRQNPVKHKLVNDAKEYRWCSAKWFEENVSRTFLKTVEGFKVDTVKIYDDF